MDFPKPPFPSNPLLSLSTFIHRLGTEIAARIDDTKRLTGNLGIGFPSPLTCRHRPLLASVSQPKPTAATTSLSTEQVAKTLIGTSVYTVSNSDNEFVLVSDPNGAKSIGLLCFRPEDAQALLSEVRLRRRELGSEPKVVPVTLDQIYSLKVEGIAFRFLPDPLQIKNALELKASDSKSGFDGVPVFQSDLLVVKKRNKRYCPIYFHKEDIERELLKVSPRPRGSGVNQHIMVGSFEDVLRKMEMNEKNMAWEDLIFVPPGKTSSQHIDSVMKG